MATPNLTPASSYEDLRSHQLETKRIKKTAQKYDNFKHVKAGQVGLPHYVNNVNQFRRPGELPSWPGDIQNCKIIILSKRQLFEEALYTNPKCRHKGRCPEKASKYSIRSAKQQEQRARAEAESWSKSHTFSDFTKKPDYYFYDKLAWWDAEDELEHDWLMDERAFNRFELQDEFGEVQKNFDEQLDFGPLVDAAVENWKMAATHRKAWGNWTEIPADWLFSPEYELVEGDEQFMSEFELI